MKHFIGFELVWFVVSYILAVLLVGAVNRKSSLEEQHVKEVIVAFLFIFLLGTGIYLLLT